MRALLVTALLSLPSCLSSDPTAGTSAEAEIPVAAEKPAPADRPEPVENPATEGPPVALEKKDEVLEEPARPEPAPEAAAAPASAVRTIEKPTVADQPAVEVSATNEPAAESAARSPEPDGLDPVYDRIAEDLRAGEPLIIAAHYGMWQARADQPDRNLNWGVYYGHATMMRRSESDRHIAKNYRHTDWEIAYESKRATDPLRKLVWKTTVKPNARWRKAGVESPFEAYLVMYAWENQEAAALAATRILRRGDGESLELDDGTRLDVGKAQLAGYFGHNFFYDYAGFDWDGFEAIEGAPDRPVGAFSVGCKTARVPGFDQWWSPKVVPFLFSRTLMASEGYSTLALVDGVLRRMDGRELVEHADATYRYFQKLGKPDRRVGRPFVSRTHRFRP